MNVISNNKKTKCIVEQMAAYYTTERSESSDASAEPSLDINDEIALLKEKFGPYCNVMDNMGDFLHVISIVLQDLNVKIKLQISGILFTIIRFNFASTYVLIS